MRVNVHTNKNKNWKSNFVLFPFQDSCTTKPCPSESKCEELAGGTHRCLCPSGLVYNEPAKTCEKGTFVTNDHTLKAHWSVTLKPTVKYYHQTC